MERAIEALRRALKPKSRLIEQEPMARHCSFRVGGPADLMLIPCDEQDLKTALQTLSQHGVPVQLLGLGSNLLVGDLGVRGAVVKTTALQQCSAAGQTICCGAGLLLSRLAVFAQKRGLSGLEFAHGIPGTVGGGVLMNAGAYGGELCDVLVSSRYIDENFEVKCREKAAHDFGYRSSAYAGGGLVIVEATFELRPDEPAAIKARMDEFAARRKEKQPLELPSAGSMFKRPPGHFAGELIERCGLKGFSVGGAQVSPKHAGFVVNTGGATAADICALIERVQSAVLQQTGVALQCEVRRMGEF